MPQIAQLMQRYAQQVSLEQFNGVKRTAIPGVHFYRDAIGNPRKPLLYQSGIIIIGQGLKKIYLGDQMLSYGGGDYLVLGVPLPLECEALTEDGKPLLGISIDVETALLQQLVTQISRTPFKDAVNRPSLDLGIKSVALSDGVLKACERLLFALLNEADAAVLGKDIVKELIYRVLMGEQGHTLLSLIEYDGHYAHIARALDKVHKEYAEELNVEQLAETANMSVSAFHRAFKQVTTDSPLQYVKKVRLVKAQEMIKFEGKRASEAAMAVGYASASQFSREYKRHFNQSPRAAMHASRADNAA